MDDILDKLNNIGQVKNILQEKFSLKFNPFPKSGIAIINDNDNIVSKLTPVDKDVTAKIITYINDALGSVSFSVSGVSLQTS